MKAITSGRLIAVGLVILAIALVGLIVPSGQYIFLPDPAHPVAPLVTVEGGKDPARGGVYFVDVVVRKATLLERIFGGLHKGADLYPAEAVEPPGVDDAERRRLDQQDMRLSQQVAAAVALRAAGKDVAITPIGARISFVEEGFPAFGKLDAGDVVVAVDGDQVRTLRDVFTRMTQHKVGDVVAFTVRRGKQTRVVRMKTIASPAPPRRPVVGVSLESAVSIKLPLSVRIDAGNVGGPSAGVAFALEVMEELGRDVVHGHRIAATGEIHPDGSIGAIGGIKQKTIGAKQAHVDAFLVPAGDNAREARRYADGLRIIPVETFPQALRALATLGRNA